MDRNAGRIAVGWFGGRLGRVPTMVIAVFLMAIPLAAIAGELKVVGPSGGAPGDIILLRAEVDGAEGYKFAWTTIPPVTSSGRPTSLRIADDQLIVASIPGSYSVVCAAGNGEEVLQTLWTVTIEGGQPKPPGPGPQPPDPVPPAPDPDLSALAKAAYGWTKLVDRPTEEKLAFAGAYRRTAGAIRSASHAGVEFTPQQAVKLLAEEVGALATADFRTAWQAWSDSYKAEMQRLNLRTAKEHADAWDDVATGIERAAQ